MKGKEVYIPEQNKGVVDKGLGLWQKVNKITLGLGVTVGAVGVAVGAPIAATLGFGSAIVDGVQMIAIKEIQKRRERSASVAIAGKSGTIVDFRRNSVPQPVAA